MYLPKEKECLCKYDINKVIVKLDNNKQFIFWQFFRYWFKVENIYFQIWISIPNAPGTQKNQLY